MILEPNVAHAGQEGFHGRPSCFTQTRKTLVVIGFAQLACDCSLIGSTAGVRTEVIGGWYVVRFAFAC